MNYFGKKVCKGIAVGSVVEIERKFENIKRVTVTDTNKELDKFNKAKVIVISQLEKLYKNVCDNIGEEEAYIFKVHKMLLEDTDINEAVESIVKEQNVCIEYAISVVEEKFVAMFMDMDDEYLKQRATDVKDVSNRLQETLNDMSLDDFYANITSPSVIVADDLLPSEIIKLNKDNILAIVCRQGSLTSHTAIIAKAMNKPFIVQVGNLPKDISDKLIIVDCFSDVIVLDPSDKDLNKYKKQISILDKDSSNEFEDMIGKRYVDKKGKKVQIYANCNYYEEVKKAYDNDAEGIGLFRTEFMYIERDKLPDEKHQYELYKNVLMVFNNKEDDEKRVCIRTFDIGADKKCKSLHIPYETNPALGRRGIRLALSNLNVLKTQLRALFKASIYGKLAIVFPMITSLDEVIQIKKIIKEIKLELKNQNIIYNDNIEIGVMIETPAAALISDKLAKEVDFFSIGSNDLTQYTLAADRLNADMKEYYNVYHEAVFDMIQMTIDNAHKNGIWVGICGDLACDKKIVKMLVDMGVDELSVPTNMVLEIRNVIMEE